MIGNRGFLYGLNKKAKDMKLFFAIICILLAVCNMTVPYFVPARNHLIITSQKFQEVLESLPFETLIENGELSVPENMQRTIHWKSDEDYAIGFLMEPADISADNYINFNEAEAVFSFNGNMVLLPYNRAEMVTIREFTGVLYGAADSLTTMNFLSALIWSVMHVMLLLCLYVMIAFIVLKSIKRRILAKYASASLALASFIPALTALVFTDNILITAGLFSFAGAVIMLLLAIPDYSAAKAQEYLGEMHQQLEFPWKLKKNKNKGDKH